MSNIAEAKAQLEEGLFDSDSDNDGQQSSSDEDSDDDDTSSLVHLKPALKKGDRVVAAWWDLEIGQKINSEGTPWFAGKVKSVKEKDHYSGSRASKYGPIRVYNIDYDDGDKLKGVLDVFVCPERDYELLDKRNLRGVKNDKDETSSDRYAKEIGWYKTTVGEEKRYATVYEAMKKADEHTIKVKKDVRKSDLNLPEEWELPKPQTKKRGRSKKVDNEDGNPVKKKKKKPNMEELFDHTGSETDDTGDNATESIVPDQGSLPGDGEPKYTGVSKLPKHIGTYRSIFYQNDNTQKSAGVYKLRADAAHARDECCRELVGLVRDGNGPNFNTVEEYKKAREREIAARGLSLKDVGTLSEITAKIQEKRNAFKDGKQRSSDASEEESEEESKDESLASGQGADDESVADSKQSVDGKTKTIGVTYVQSKDRYRGKLVLNNKTHFAGEFVLKADATYARDELCRAIGITSRGFNFKTVKEYKDARAKEIKRRGLSLDETGTVTDIFNRIETKRTKWNQIKGRNSDTDDSSQSSDDVPLMSMKTKRRRLASTREMATKSTSDYRGVTHNQNDGKCWSVSIFYNDEDRFVGKYDLESDAARVYDEVSAILVSNDDPNFANKSDHEEARRREAEKLGLNLESIATFQESIGKAEIYVHKLLSSAGVNDSERAVRKRRSSSPFTPILTDCDMESSASPVENVNDSNKKIADLNEAMTMKWGRRLPTAGNLFIDSYQQNLCEMLGGCVDESSKTPIGTFVSISSFPLDGQESNDEDLDGGESTGVSPQNTGMNSTSNFGDKLSDDLVAAGTIEGTLENQMPFEQHENIAEATHDNQEENILETKKPDELHEHVGIPADQDDDGVQERKSGTQGNQKVDLSNDDKKEDVKYAGVSKHKESNRFRGNVWRNGKQKSVGEYVLKADAAHARDEFCRSFNLNRPLNFHTKDEYLQARAKEIAERGLTMDAADTKTKKKDVVSLSEVAAKLQKKKAEWDAESKKSNSDSPILPEDKSRAEETTNDDNADDDISLFSNANDDVPSQDSVALTGTTSNVTAETTKPDLSGMNLAEKPAELHKHVGVPANQYDSVQEKKSGSQVHEKNDLSNDDKKEEMKYVGVTKVKRTNRFKGRMFLNNKQKSFGEYVLKADAAHARDEYCRSFNLNKPLNFNTQEEYLHMRANEIAERGLTLDAADTAEKKKDVLSLSGVAAKLQKKKAEWDAESKKSSLDSPTLPGTKSQANKQTTQDDNADDDISLFSDANNEQDNFVPSQDSAAVTVAKSNVTAETSKPDLSQMNLVQVTKKQEEKLEFPVGCPVLWKLPDGSLQKGKVTSAWLNMKKSVSLVYGVQPLNRESKQMKSASELMFDTHCPVDIKQTDKNTVVEGEVLVSKTDGAKTLYTVLVKKEGNEFQLKHEVPFDQLSYRKVAKENPSPSRVGENSEPSNKMSMRSEQNSETKTNSAKEVQPRRLSSPEKEGLGHCDMSISTSNSTISTRDSGRMSTPRGRSGNVWDGRSIDIELPNWFVSDNVIRDRLEYQLTGSPGGRRTIFSQIHDRTNCTLKMSSHGSNVIRIETNPRKYAIDSLRKAKIELENFFLDYLNRDGCIGRLFYDLAVSCKYLHPQRGRSCVYQRNPWEPNDMGYMSVVELPYLGNDWDRAQTFHSRHLLSKEFRVLSRVNSVGCTVMVVDKRGRVPTKWTRPYVWVWGHKPGDVDDAVQILEDANREHANSCGCRLPR